MKQGGQYDRLGLTEAMLRSDIDELYGDWKGHGKTITGQETFQDLLDLDVVDEVILEPIGGAHRDRDFCLNNVRESVRKN